ncbi:MAG: TonB-dependent receptor [Pseudomonadales bacterium]|nr:TonB-dependent receptor [Pseudomonadales bacterium]
MKILASAVGMSIGLMLNGSLQAQEDIEEIQITGSRITRSGMVTPTPVTTVTLEEIGNLSPGNMVDALSQLPQFLNNQTATNRGNFLGAAGGAFLNVRGVGTNRTLVLLNGRRVPGSDRNGRVDTNLFPESLVRQVEVVTGGASAAYGADALSGVVNFILDTKYTGFEAKFQGGQTKFDDGENWEASISGGFAVGDRIHVTGALEAFHQNQVQGEIAALDERDWFQRLGFVTNPAWKASDPPGTNPQRLVLPNVHSTQFTPGGKINQPGFSLDQHVFTEDGSSTRPFIPGSVAAINTGTLSTSGGPEFDLANRGERTNLGAEVERGNAFLNVDIDLTDNATVFFRTMIGKNDTYLHDVNGGLGPSMMGIWSATIFQDNAFLPENVRQAMIAEGRQSIRMDKNGQIVGRINMQDDMTDGTEILQRVFSTGLDMEFANDWTLSAFLQYGDSDKDAKLDNLLRIDRLFLAMDAVRDPATGEIVCNVQLHNPTREQLAASVANVRVSSPQGPVGIASPVGLDGTIENCVPLNIFGTDNISQAAADYVVSDKWAESEVEQEFSEVVLSGDLFDNWYAGALSFSVGATYRHEKMSQVEFPRDIAVLGPPQNVPALGIRGIPGGFTGGSPNLHQFSTLQTFGGSFDVWEIFGETFVPLYVSTTSSRRVGLSLAGRRSQYSRAGTVETWKAGLDAQLTESLRFRGTFSHDAREATFSELFDLNGGGGGVNDPVFNGNRFDITVNSGGNPDLKPEEADTFTVGLVYQPQWLEGLSFSGDYYSIDLSETIGSLGTQRIVDDCELNQVAQACSLIDRDPVTNIITRVSNVLVNIAAAKVRGVDLELSYRMEPDLFASQFETLSFRMLAGYLAENSSTPLNGVKLDSAGTGVFPSWTTTTTLNYGVGPVSGFIQHRFIDSTRLNALWTEGVDVDDNSISSVDYTNVGLTYTYETASGGSVAVFGNVTNLFNEHPPVIPTNVGRSIAGSPGLNQHNAISLGRRFVVGATAKF